MYIENKGLVVVKEVCVCVCVTQLSYKRIASLNCPFSMTGKRLIVLVYECLRGPFMVLLLWRNLVKEKEGAWRRRIYRKYASCKWLKDTGLEFTRADVVVSISRGPPGQWFPKTEYWASAIFVVTSGIPPKIIYRRVKSYTLNIFNFTLVNNRMCTLHIFNLILVNNRMCTLNIFNFTSSPSMYPPSSNMFWS